MVLSPLRSSAAFAVRRSPCGIRRALLSVQRSSNVRGPSHIATRRVRGHVRVAGIPTIRLASLQ